MDDKAKNRMEKDVAIPIALDVWQCTSEYAIMEQYDDTIYLRFKYWDEKQNEVIDKTALLTFSGVWICKYSRFNQWRYYPQEIENIYKSYYLIVSNSSCLLGEEAKRSRYDSDWRMYDKRDYKHYVFQNNSYYIEIIAAKVEFKIEERRIQDECIWNE